MKIAYLEKHTYAPELNRLVLENGVSFKAPQCKTIKEARSKLFKPVQFVRYIKVRVKSNKDYLDKGYNLAIIDGKIWKNKTEFFTVSEFIQWVKNNNKPFVAMNGEEITYQISFQTGSKWQ